jgi:hypothetical protein
MDPPFKGTAGSKTDVRVPSRKKGLQCLLIHRKKKNAVHNPGAHHSENHGAEETKTAQFTNCSTSKINASYCPANLTKPFFTLLQKVNLMIQPTDRCSTCKRDMRSSSQAICQCTAEEESNPLKDVETKHHNKREVIINLRDCMYLFVKPVQVRQMPEGITRSRIVQAYWAEVIRIFYLTKSGGRGYSQARPT